MARYWIGTSGWSYDGWAGLFYPKGLKRTEWLAYYAERYPSVEVNASFYHLPRESVLAGWAERTPEGFVIAVKAWRAITHRRRLVDCAEPTAVFLDRLEALGDTCGPVLFQLPPRMEADAGRLAGFLELLPQGRRYAFEFRDPRWHRDDVYRVLEAANAAFCAYELASNVSPRTVTADFVYVRLHGRQARYRGTYDEAALAEWSGWLAGRLAEGRDAYLYFDNTDEADHALANARRLAGMLKNAAIPRQG